MQDAECLGGVMTTIVVPRDFGPFPWMKYVLQEFNKGEIDAPMFRNPRLLDYVETCGLCEGDEIAWGSAFANWCMRRAGLRGSGRAHARSWLSWGSALPEPVYGCVIVLWRETPVSAVGHVSFYLGRDGSHLWLLGSNQSNAISIKSFSSHRLLGVRWPSAI
jgi:uncharacterized protein (TIGR02594 family)